MISTFRAGRPTLIAAAALACLAVPMLSLAEPPAAAPPAAADSYSVTRHFKEGDVDKYSLKVATKMTGLQVKHPTLACLHDPPAGVLHVHSPANRVLALHPKQ